MALFIPHNGCPHKCTFCNQRNIVGQAYQPNADDVTNAVKIAVDSLKENTKEAEIAFFGGSFTAIDREYMLELLDATKPFINSFKGIRLSTRPDCIDDEIVSLLKSYKVTSIELGAQSMDDEVLKLNERGHTADDVRNACRIIKNYGISLGLQMMTGLYGSDFYKDIYTADEFIKFRPDTVRIYPTVIMQDTELANLYNSKKFIPYTLEQSVELCSKLILKFKSENIRIIRLGLHYSESLENNSLGNNYHPAFKELCENKIFFDKITKLIKNYPDKEVDFFEAYVNPHSVSKLAGQNKSNIIRLNNMGYKLKIKTDQSLDEYEIYIKQR